MVNGHGAPWGAFCALRCSVTVTPSSSAAAFSAFAAGMREAWGTAPAEIGVGGSIPLVSLLAERFPKAAVLVTGVGGPTSRIHGPDESQDLGELRHSILGEAIALLRLPSRGIRAAHTRAVA